MISIKSALAAAFVFAAMTVSASAIHVTGVIVFHQPVEASSFDAMAMLEMELELYTLVYSQETNFLTDACEMSDRACVAAESVSQ